MTNFNGNAYFDTPSVVVPAKNFAGNANLFFMNSYTGVGEALENVWQTIDVHQKFGIPKEANSLFISGILIITKGSASGTENLTMAFKSPEYGDDTTNVGYVFQTIEAHQGGGQRSNAATRIPVYDGKIQLRWDDNRDGGLEWPQVASFGLNINIVDFTLPLSSFLPANASTGGGLSEADVRNIAKEEIDKMYLARE